MRGSSRYRLLINARVRSSLESSPIRISRFECVCAMQESMHSANSSGRLNVGKQIEIFVGRMCSPDGVSGNCLRGYEAAGFAIVCAFERTCSARESKNRYGSEEPRLSSDALYGPITVSST